MVPRFLEAEMPRYVVIREHVRTYPGEGGKAALNKTRTKFRKKLPAGVPLDPLPGGKKAKASWYEREAPKVVAKNVGQNKRGKQAKAIFGTGKKGPKALTVAQRQDLRSRARNLFESQDFVQLAKVIARLNRQDAAARARAARAARRASPVPPPPPPSRARSMSRSRVAEEILEGVF